MHPTSAHDYWAAITAIKGTYTKAAYKNVYHTMHEVTRHTDVVAGHVEAKDSATASSGQAIDTVDEGANDIAIAAVKDGAKGTAMFAGKQIGAKDIAIVAVKDNAKGITIFAVKEANDSASIVKGHHSEFPTAVMLQTAQLISTSDLASVRGSCWAV